MLPEFTSAWRMVAPFYFGQHRSHNASESGRPRGWSNDRGLLMELAGLLKVREATSLFRYAIVVSTAVSSCAWLGCGGRPGRNVKLAPVSGKVTYRDKPLDHGQIVFVHDSGEMAASEIAPDGTYQGEGGRRRKPYHGGMHRRTESQQHRSQRRPSAADSKELHSREISGLPRRPA